MGNYRDEEKVNVVNVLQVYALANFSVRGLF